jgi:hypothetical protein
MMEEALECRVSPQRLRVSAKRQKFFVHRVTIDGTYQPQRRDETKENVMKELLLVICTAVLLAASSSNTAEALPIGQAIEAIGDQLVSGQGPSGGWPGEAGFTGSIVAGLANAYETTGNAAYSSAAQLGGNYIISTAGGNFYGDEAYALARLTEITGDASYANAARDFYDGIDTLTYIAGFAATDRSNAVFYVAQHTVAASMVGAADAGLWRAGLTQYLAQIADDKAFYPVQSLGVATWALAESGPMDGTEIDPFDIGEPYWSDVTLGDLATLLVTHQLASGAYAGSFYLRFDHDVPGAGYEASGYTEDAVFGVLGLIGTGGFDANVLTGRSALASGITLSGVAYEHIWSGGASYYTYGGEVVQALPEPA